MNTFFRNFAITGIMLLSFFGLTGCQDEVGLRPEDTVVGSKKHNRPDWIDETKLYAKEGLSFREDFNLDEADNAALASSNGIEETENLQVIAQVYFSYDNSGVQADEREKLQEAIEFINNHPNNKFLLTGHCDWHGTQEYNMALGDKRANSVQSYLYKLGASPDNLKTRSRGSLDSVKEALDDQAQYDRRADIVMIK